MRWSSRRLTCSRPSARRSARICPWSSSPLTSPPSRSCSSPGRFRAACTRPCCSACTKKAPPPWGWTSCLPIPPPRRKTRPWRGPLPRRGPWCSLPRGRRSTAPTPRCGWRCSRCSGFWTPVRTPETRVSSRTMISWCAGRPWRAKALRCGWHSARPRRAGRRRRCATSTGSATGARAARLTPVRTTRRWSRACCPRGFSRARSCWWGAPCAPPPSSPVRRPTSSTPRLAQQGASGCFRAWSCRPPCLTTT